MQFTAHPASGDCMPPAHHFRASSTFPTPLLIRSQFYWRSKTLAYRVPFVDPREHYRRLKREIDFAITDTLAKGDLVLRKQLSDFEQHLADFVGVKYAVGVNSGYHALYFCLLAAGIGPGDEVITVGHTLLATV